MVVNDVPGGHVFEIDVPVAGVTPFIKLESGRYNCVNLTTYLPGVLHGNLGVLRHFQLRLSPKLVDVVRRIDYKLLADQKAWLVSSSASGPSANFAEGILGLLDTIMDAVVDDGILSERDVFGGEDDKS